MTSKTWDFTLNNYTQADIDMFRSWTNEVTRMVVSEEVGEKCGTQHLQGRITFRRSYRLAALKKLHTRAHWEQTKAAQDFIYPMKEGSHLIIDVDNRKQGHRSELQNAIEDAKKGKSIRHMWENHTPTMVRYEKGIKRCREVMTAVKVEADYKLADFRWEPITDWSKTVIIKGAAGIGKTEFAKAHFENPLFVTHMDDLLDFDEHDGIIFDDMSFTHLPRTAQIHLVDQDNPRSLHCRYARAHIPAHTKKIITCNTMCLDIDDEAIGRRVTVTEVR